MTYCVLVVLRDKFVPFDNRTFARYPDARRCQLETARKYPYVDTAVGQAGRVLNFRESSHSLATIENERRQA